MLSSILRSKRAVQVNVAIILAILIRGILGGDSGRTLKDGCLISTKSRGPVDYVHPEKERSIGTLELKLLEGNILFDQQRAVLVITGPYDLHSKQIATADHWALKGAGYFEATDDEMNILRQAGYQLPDWRELSVADLGRQYPAWNSKPT